MCGRFCNFGFCAAAFHFFIFLLQFGLCIYSVVFMYVMCIDLFLFVEFVYMFPFVLCELTKYV